jgi:preprotein translocase subunit YajC
VGFLLPLLLLGVVFYFLLIRPQRRQRQKQQELLSSLQVGDEVQTIGGMFGTVRSLDDTSVMLEVAPGVQVRFVKGAIARKLVFEEGGEPPEGESPEEEEAGEQT